MKMSFFSKLAIIFGLLGLTYLYSTYERNKFVRMDEENLGAPVLKTLPNFNLEIFPSAAPLASADLLGKGRGFYFHIWGSWCGPCEEEMPQFLDYARKLTNEGVSFLLVAVNDKPEDVAKFMKRFGQLPPNVTIAIDKENKIMEKFGTFKVPETFLFDKQGKNVNKFVGPQDWMADSYVTRLNTWLGPVSAPMIQVESH